MLRIFSNRIEFFNMGGLLPDADRVDILSGMSLPRNPNLSNVFLKLNWVENFGSGIPKIFSQYKNCIYQPEFNISLTSFRVLLPVVIAKDNSSNKAIGKRLTDGFMNQF